MSATDNYFIALLGIAETFRTQNPPAIKLCVQSLSSLFHLPLSNNLQVIAHFQLGKVLHRYTRNADIARAHLEQASQLAVSLSGFDEMRLQISSLLAQIYAEQKQLPYCKETLRGVLEASRAFPHWHARLLFQSAEAYVAEGEPKAAVQLLEAGAEFCAASQSLYTEALFRLSKAMLLMQDRNAIEEVHRICQEVKTLIDGVSAAPARKAALKAFFLAVQVCHMLMFGKVKDAKECLKLLQSCFQTITSASDAEDAEVGPSLDSFQWLSKDLLCILVYVVSVVHAMQGGQMEKAAKYTDKGLSQLEKLRNSSEASESPLLPSFQVLLLENSAMQRLILGQPSLAIKEISQICTIASTNTAIFTAHEAQTHTLLGLYAMSLKETDTAVRQFNTALKVAKDVDLWCLVNLNMAMMFLQEGRDQDFYSMLERINPDRLPSNSRALQAASFFIRGLQSFLHNRHQEAKRYLKDCLAISNEEDLSRLSAAALVLLANICLRFQNVTDCSSMLQPALELANRIPDLSLQIWATQILKEVYLLCEETKKGEEAAGVEAAYSTRLAKDTARAQGSEAHALLSWVEGPCLYLPNTSAS